jgi:hypothetical protein
MTLSITIKMKHSAKTKLSMMKANIMKASMIVYYAESHILYCRAECRYSECRYAERRGVIFAGVL